MIQLGFSYTAFSDASLERLKGFVEHLADLTQPQRLDLRGTKVTDDGLEHLKGLTQLRALHLGNTHVTDAGLEHLKGLTQLRALSLVNIHVSSLGNTHVTDAGLEHLKGLTQLRALYLGNTHVTDDGLKHLKGFTQLQRLDLGGTQVTDDGLDRLKGLTQLQRLDLQHTNVTNDGLNRLTGLTQLQWLNLGNTHVTDAGLEHLKGLTQLQHLNLQATEVTNAGLEHLKGLTQLQWLDLYRTAVTDAAAEHLKGFLTQLRDLRFTGKVVSDCANAIKYKISVESERDRNDCVEWIDELVTADADGRFAVPILVDVIRSDYDSSDDWQLRNVQCAIQGITRYGLRAKMAIDSLIEVLEQEAGRLRMNECWHDTEFPCTLAAEAIRAIGPEAIHALPALIDVVEAVADLQGDDSDVLDEFYKLRQWIRHPGDGIASISDGESDSATRALFAAVDAIVGFGKPAVPALTELLHSDLHRFAQNLVARIEGEDGEEDKEDRIDDKEEKKGERDDLLGGLASLLRDLAPLEAPIRRSERDVPPS